MPRPHFGAATDRQEGTRTNFLPIPQLGWLQPKEASLQTSRLVNMNTNFSTETTQHTHTLELKQKNNVEWQTSPLKGNSPEKYGTNKKPFQERETRSTATFSSTTPRRVKSKPRTQITN